MYLSRAKWHSVFYFSWTKLASNIFHRWNTEIACDVQPLLHQALIAVNTTKSLARFVKLDNPYLVSEAELLRGTFCCAHWTVARVDIFFPLVQCRLHASPLPCSALRLVRCPDIVLPGCISVAVQIPFSRLRLLDNYWLKNVSEYFNAVTDIVAF